MYTSLLLSIYIDNEGVNSRSPAATESLFGKFNAALLDWQVCTESPKQHDVVRCRFATDFETKIDQKSNRNPSDSPRNQSETDQERTPGDPGRPKKAILKFLRNFFQVCCHFGAPKDGPGAAQGAPRPAQGAPGRPRGRPGAADATQKKPKSSPKRSQEQLGGRPRSKSTFEAISGSIFIGLATENHLRIEREFLKKLCRKCRRRTLRICVSTEPARAELTSAKRQARQTNAEI